MLLFNSLQDEDITLPQSFMEAATKAGMKEAEIENAIKYSTEKECKDRLKAVTDEACEHGVRVHKAISVASLLQMLN